MKVICGAELECAKVGFAVSRSSRDSNSKGCPCPGALVRGQE
jgi:hypothetical protein